MQHHLIRIGRTYCRKESGRVLTRRVVHLSRIVGVPQDGKGRSAGALIQVSWVDQDGQGGETSLRSFAWWAQTEIPSAAAVVKKRTADGKRSKVHP